MPASLDSSHIIDLHVQNHWYVHLVTIPDLRALQTRIHSLLVMTFSFCERSLYGMANLAMNQARWPISSHWRKWTLPNFRIIFNYHL